MLINVEPRGQLIQGCRPETSEEQGPHKDRFGLSGGAGVAVPGLETVGVAGRHRMIMTSLTAG